MMAKATGLMLGAVIVLSLALILAAAMGWLLFAPAVHVLGVAD